MRLRQQRLLPGENFKGRRRFGFHFLKAHELEWLTSRQTLRAQTGLSLKDRVKHFQQKFPSGKLNPTLLSKVYRKHRIRRRRIVWKKKDPTLTEEELQREKRKMARQLEKVQKEGYRVIYIDETMFTRTTVPKSEYCLPKDNMSVDKQLTNEPTLALLSGVSKEKG